MRLSNLSEKKIYCIVYNENTNKIVLNYYLVK